MLAARGVRRHGMATEAATAQRAGPDARVSPAVLVGLAAVLGLAWWAYHPLLGLGHLGWDTWPLIWSARISSLSDLGRTFGEPLMDGLYPHGAFYRPLLDLSVALDHALWGLEPRGYHRTDLLLLLLTVGAVFGVGRRLLGDAAAALVACAVFALHPLHFESLPVTARRGDALANLFTLLALWSVPFRGRGRGAASALFALLAVASKETGVLAAPLVGVLAYGEAEGPTRERVGRGLRAAGPALAAVAAFGVVRTVVLGGLGGHVGSSLLGGLLRAPALLVLFGDALLVPQPQGVPWLAALLALGIVVALVALAGAGAGPRGRAPLEVLGTWLAGLLLLSAASGDLAPWYAATFLPAYGLAVGWLVAGARRAWRAGARPVAGIAAAVALALAVAGLRYSGVFVQYDQWSSLDAAVARYLDALRPRIEAAEPGGPPLLAPGLPERLPRSGAVGVHGAAGLGSYSVQAWAALTLPDTPVRVATAPGPVAPDEILVVVPPDEGG